ncbi:nitroreductase family protein [Leucobacter sp. UT-8R-CII-1-4]|uniref:nitroreductase family protein n=1 Tax=Leucobacter sp. UT-8R-CII-1-4 TaxID=3040075 RepID=UPI0024A8478B|nr:nitroreductase family protein [Leucobacter sp. UT-8R-CII-1-4]MDI6021976.1 nitroreductase family protein [Leucobacter sp. UT-8R-CII-1-4]
MHPNTFFAERFSPMRFSTAHEPSQRELRVILEAAQSAPSAGNSQPWSFIVGMRGEDTHTRLSAHLARSSTVWAPSASYLIANVRQRFIEGSELEYSEFGRYDLGQAVAYMTVQAHSLGLASHQFRAFKKQALTEAFQLPEHLEIVTMTAIGLADHLRGEVVGSGTDRTRRELDSLVFAGDLSR